MDCPLCLNSEWMSVVEGPDHRSYQLCNKCRIIFTDTNFYPTIEEERIRYLEHNNGPQFKGYVKFLNRAIVPALEFLESGMKGLDYGCGPVPTLSKILQKNGYICDDYDPVFFPELDHNKQYDFIFSTECFEHFFYPAKELQQIKKILKQEGYLIIMTDKWKSLEQFKNWYYAKDNTHVTFYHEESLQFIAEKFGFEQIESGDERVSILKNDVDHL